MIELAKGRGFQHIIAYSDQLEMIEHRRIPVLHLPLLKLLLFFSQEIEY